MSTEQRSDWFSLETATRQVDSSLSKNILWLEEEDEEEEERRRKKRRVGLLWTPCCQCCIVGLLIGAVILAIVLSLWLKSKSNVTTTIKSSAATSSTSSTSSTRTTSSSTTTSSSSATTSSSSTTATSSSTTTSSSSTTTTATTTTTTPINYCSEYRWNQTGNVVAGSSMGSAANQLRNPSCLVIDRDDNMYICDTDNNRIQKWTPGSTTGVTVAGSSTGISGSSSVLLDSPMDLVFDKNGYLYVADHQNHRVQRFAPNSTIGVTVAGVTGQLTNALNEVDHLVGIDVDNKSNLFIMDQHNNRIVEWTVNATIGTVLVQNANLLSGYDLLLSPFTQEQVYISVENTNSIYLWQFHASSPSLTLNQVNSSANTLRNPKGMVFDRDGNLYVADATNNRIVMYCRNSTIGIVVAGGLGTTPALSDPTGVAFDSDMNLYVVTAGSNRVVKFPLT